MMDRASKLCAYSVPIELTYDGRKYTLIGNDNRAYRVGDILCEIERTAFIFQGNSEIERRALSALSKILETLEFSGNERESAISSPDFLALIKDIDLEETLEYRIETFDNRMAKIYRFKCIASLIFFELTNCIDNNIAMKRCKNCGYHFPLHGRPDVVYCSYPIGEGMGKTCKAVGAQNTRATKEREDAVTAAYRKLYMRMKMQTRRHPKDRAAADQLAEFVREGKRWRILIEREPEDKEKVTAAYFAAIKAFEQSVENNVVQVKGGEKMSRKEHHVVSNPNGGWDVKRSGAGRASVHTETKAAAVSAGREISRNQGSELIIHRKDGRIQNPDSHGNDPCPPKDKK